MHLRCIGSVFLNIPKIIDPSVLLFVLCMKGADSYG